MSDHLARIPRRPAAKRIIKQTFLRCHGPSRLRPPAVPRGHFDSFCADPTGRTSWILPLQPWRLQGRRPTDEKMNKSQKAIHDDTTWEPKHQGHSPVPPTYANHRFSDTKTQSAGQTTPQVSLPHKRLPRSVPMLSTTFKNLWVFGVETPMTSLRRAQLSRRRGSVQPPGLGLRNSPTKALFSLSCLIFADQHSFTSGDAQARLGRTRASPDRPSNTSTQTDNDSSNENLCRESISDNQGAFVRTAISLTLSAWPGSIHFASGEREKRKKLLEIPQTTIARIRVPVPISATQNLGERCEPCRGGVVNRTCGSFQLAEFGKETSVPCNQSTSGTCSKFR